MTCGLLVSCGDDVVASSLLTSCYCSLLLFCCILLLLLMMSHLCYWPWFHRSNKLETSDGFICCCGET